MGIIKLLVCAALLAGGIFALTIVLDGDEQEPAGTVASVALPEPDPEVAASDRDFLAGRGAPTLRIHAKAAAIADEGSADCSTTIARLDREATPDEALSLAASIGDEPLRALLQLEQSTLGQALSSCEGGLDPDADLKKIVARLDQRLEEMGIDAERGG